MQCESLGVSCLFHTLRPQQRSRYPNMELSKPPLRCTLDLVKQSGLVSEHKQIEPYLIESWQTLVSSNRMLVTPYINWTHVINNTGNTPYKRTSGDHHQYQAAKRQLRLLEYERKHRKKQTVVINSVFIHKLLRW